MPKLDQPFIDKAWQKPYQSLNDCSWREAAIREIAAKSIRVGAVGGIPWTKAAAYRSSGERRNEIATNWVNDHEQNETEAHIATIKINNLEDVHCVRDVRFGTRKT
jgi:hypothetical protein